MTQNMKYDYSYLESLKKQLERSQSSFEENTAQFDCHIKNMISNLDEKLTQTKTHSFNQSLPESQLQILTKKLTETLSKQHEIEIASIMEKREKEINEAVEKTKDEMNIILNEKVDELKVAIERIKQLEIVEGQNKELLGRIEDLSKEIEKYRGTIETMIKAKEELVKKHQKDKEKALRKLSDEKDAEKKTALENLRRSFKETIAEATRAKAAAQNERDEYKEFYRKERLERMKIHNKLIEMQGNIRVLCRVRPMLLPELETDDNREVTDIVSEEEITILKEINNKTRPQKYEFDRVFGCESSQEDIFDFIEPLCTSVLDGFNNCIFAYGQTGTGKTYTMEGNGTGVSPKSINEIFKRIEERNELYTYKLSFSMLQIYNETVYDLLDNLSNKLDVKMTSEGKYEVTDAKEIVLESPEHALNLIKEGNSNRNVASHKMNQESSRSHCIMTIKCEGVNKLTDSPILSKMHLVDLAGSERISKTEATGERLIEANAINKSLLALGDVISAIASKNSHIPYRNSKLTYLLQDALGGSSKVFTIVNISPSSYNCNESICSLNFAARCRLTDIGSATMASPGAVSRFSADDNGNGVKNGDSIKSKQRASRRASVAGIPSARNSISSHRGSIAGHGSDED